MILGAIFNGIMAAIQNRRAKKEKEKALKILDQEEEELDNLFNETYYSDYMKRADVQQLINTAKSHFQSSMNNIQGRATVMGGTDEWVGANQRRNSEQLSSLYSNLASQGVQWKDSVLNNYRAQKANINAQRYGTHSNDAASYRNASFGSLNNLAQNFSDLDNKLFDSYGDKIFK